MTAPPFASAHLSEKFFDFQIVSFCSGSQSRFYRMRWFFTYRRFKYSNWRQYTVGHT